MARTSGNFCCIFGGGAAGIITNDEFGYAGDQVGVACIWLEDSNYCVQNVGGLSDGEFGAGLQLGKQLAQTGVTKASPVLLFYDSVSKTLETARMLMSTRLLEGIEEGLGFLPDIMGAGLMGDHVLTPTAQFLGGTIDEDHAFALTFSDDIHIDHVILHGCRPASPYYTVSKAEGSVILEIEGKPAIPFIDELLGSAIKPDEYPFFLIFGINHGAIDAEYDERNYASRLCQGLDKERGGIVMFEPDMVAGTQFQIMVRTQGLDYIYPQVQDLLKGLGEREPFFAIYIDCAGRCAGYGGTDMEDAYVIQDMVQDRFPLLGIYTGVEIASIGGQPRSLDWTGVFCVFSKSEASSTHTITKEIKSGLWNTETLIDGPKELSQQQMQDYCVQNLASSLALDVQNIAIRNELEQKRRGFSLLAELSACLRSFEDRQRMFYSTTRRINAALNMQKTVLLLPGKKGRFAPAFLQGYTEAEEEKLLGIQLEIDARLLDVTEAVSITAADNESDFAGLRETLNLPYFISTPIVAENELSGILITGRMMEAPPFLSRLNQTGAETIQAIAALLASITIYQRLDEANRQASTDLLTGLYNRASLERQVSALLKWGIPRNHKFAFMLMDLDNFKNVNDNHGHIVGDQVLQTFARTLSNSLRTTDIVSRCGGDEFVAFFTSIRGIKSIQSRAERLVDVWSRMPLCNLEGQMLNSTVSIGISIAPDHGSTYRELLQTADIALYESKQKGRNRCTVYDPGTMKLRS